MYAAGKLCIRVGTLAPTYADVLEIKQVRWCTLITLEISLNTLRTRYCTLVYVVIRRIDPKILYLHKKSSACADVLLIH